MRKYIYLSVLVAAALALSLLEMAIPLPFIAPGAKLGLSNMVILVCLIIFGFKDAMLVAVMKSVVLMLVTGSVTGMIYSLAGAVLSVLVMHLAYTKLSKFLSLIGVSILGATAHNFAQISVAAMVMQNIKMYNYLPILLITGIFTGYFVGMSSNYISKHLLKIGLMDKMRRE
ncbi:MAG: Gx transporter family protein [Tissierellia bacterium]|nr:Gx transporter family protein [Tissierellia bacterium]